MLPMSISPGDAGTLVAQVVSYAADVAVVNTMPSRVGEKQQECEGSGQEERTDEGGQVCGMREAEKVAVLVAAQAAAAAAVVTGSTDVLLATAPEEGVYGRILLLDTAGCGVGEGREVPEKERWQEALKELRAGHKPMQNMVALDDADAAALALRTLRTNAHKALPFFGAAVHRPDEARYSASSNEASSDEASIRFQDGERADLAQNIIHDLQEHNNKLRSELKNALKDAEHMLRAASAADTRKAHHLLDQLRMRVSSSLVYTAKSSRHRMSPNTASQVASQVHASDEGKETIANGMPSSRPESTLFQNGTSSDDSSLNVTPGSDEQDHYHHSTIFSSRSPKRATMDLDLFPVQLASFDAPKNAAHSMHPVHTINGGCRTSVSAQILVPRNLRTSTALLGCMAVVGEGQKEETRKGDGGGGRWGGGEERGSLDSGGRSNWSPSSHARVPKSNLAVLNETVRGEGMARLMSAKEVMAVRVWLMCIAPHEAETSLSTLQHTVTHCNTLQHTAARMCDAPHEAQTTLQVQRQNNEAAAAITQQIVRKQLARQAAPTPETSRPETNLSPHFKRPLGTPGSGISQEHPPLSPPRNPKNEEEAVFGDVDLELELDIADDECEASSDDEACSDLTDTSEDYLSDSACEEEEEEADADAHMTVGRAKLEEDLLSPTKWPQVSHQEAASASHASNASTVCKPTAGEQVIDATRSGVDAKRREPSDALSHDAPAALPAPSCTATAHSAEQSYAATVLASPRRVPSSHLVAQARQDGERHLGVAASGQEDVAVACGGSLVEESFSPIARAPHTPHPRMLTQQEVLIDIGVWM